MAGSFLHIPQQDPILSERINTLACLADHLSEPIIVMSPNLELVYANAPAQQLIAECPLLEQVEQEGGLMPPSQPCEACPGKNVLELGPSCEGREPFAHSSVEPTTCPFPKSLPLTDMNEQIRCVLMLGKTGRETVVLKHSPMSSAPLSKQKVSEDPSFESIVGKSPGMQQVLETIRLVASSRATVLLQGESGTGKELVAKTIHRLSSRKHAPFIVVDCGALPETLLESELFGHKRGSFTGAVADRKGLFEEAEGGTIFLDEIANTSSTFQAKLLRVLQESEVKPVGSSQTLKVDVRIISASNTPLEELMKGRAFRTDLFYRLAVLPISLPPLRERREDIPLLIDHFIQRVCQTHQIGQVEVAPEALHSLVQRTWAGNVRELEHAVERLVLTTQGRPILLHDVEESSVSPNEESDLRETGRMAQTKAEKDSIVKALHEAKGNKVLAAKLLKISRATLYNKLKAYQIH